MGDPPVPIHVPWGVEAEFLKLELMEALISGGGPTLAKPHVRSSQVRCHCRKRQLDECDVDVSSAFGEVNRVDPCLRMPFGPTGGAQKEDSSHE